VVLAFVSIGYLGPDDPLPAMLDVLDQDYPLPTLVGPIPGGQRAPRGVDLGN